MYKYILIGTTIFVVAVFVIRYLKYRDIREFKIQLYSHHLKKSLRVHIYLPINYGLSFRKYPVLLLNDGQDIKALKLIEWLQFQGRSNHDIVPLIVVAVYADSDRMRDYGTSIQPDYQNRGDHAYLYRKFIIDELTPCIKKKYRTNDHFAIAGFSLGGLSAFDIAWHHPDIFRFVGVFSGALWWRKHPYEQPEDDLTDRLAHLTVRQTQVSPKMKFWFQAGTKDEVSDRNNNGIIDAIDDTLDLIAELEHKGFELGKHIFYDQVEGGQHNFDTWSECFPKFMIQFYTK